MTLRILRAFAWMRWRVLLNSLERTGARDRLERFALAIEQIGPIIALVLLVPTLLVISALASYAGYIVATRAQISPIVQIFLRGLTLGVSGLAIIGPILLPLMERANPVRLLLLPIPRSTLYLSQASGALADPWTMIAVPIALFLPLGLSAGGAIQAAAISLLGGLLFLLALAGLSMLTSCVIQLVVRDRRRGELVALAFILFIPLVGMLTSFADRNVSRRHRHQTGSAPIERAAGPGVLETVTRGAFALTPSERYVSATRAAAAGRLPESASALLVLSTTVVLVHGFAFWLFERLLAFPGSVGPRRTATKRGTAARRIPWLSAGAGAVAMAQIRLTLRTPRGRSTLLSPLLAFCVFALLLFRRGDEAFGILPESGVGLAAFGAAISLMATLPLAMNQFAIDGAGLTLELLSPLSDEQLLDGKAIASGVIGGVPALVCLLLSLLLFPGGSVAHWISVPIAMSAVYCLLSPIAAAASVVFPRVVEMNSVGRGSNAHGLAGLIGVFSVILSGLPPIGLALATNGWFQRPELTPIVLLAWCGLTLGINRLLFRPVRALLARRRENLSLVTG
jgi:hypothetical protein